MNEAGIALIVNLLIAAAVALPIWLSKRRGPLDAPPMGAAALCAIAGHKFKDKPVPVYTSMDRKTKFKDSNGNPCAFLVHQCERCRGMRPTAESLDEAIKLNDEIASVMNGSRARYGLKPIDWRRWI